MWAWSQIRLWEDKHTGSKKGQFLCGAEKEGVDESVNDSRGEFWPNRSIWKKQRQLQLRQIVVQIKMEAKLQYGCNHGEKTPQYYIQFTGIQFQTNDTFNSEICHWNTNSK